MTILVQNLHITRSDIRPHIKWAVRLVIAYYGHFHIPQGSVWVCMDYHTHIITLKGSQYSEKIVTVQVSSSNFSFTVILILFEWGRNLIMNKAKKVKEHETHYKNFQLGFSDKAAMLLPRWLSKKCTSLENRKISGGEIAM